MKREEESVDLIAEAREEVQQDRRRTQSLLEVFAFWRSFSDDHQLAAKHMKKIKRAPVCTSDGRPRRAAADGENNIIAKLGNRPRAMTPRTYI